MSIKPGCKVEHISVPGNLGVAVRREMHGNEETGTWPVWLVVWDNQIGDIDSQNITIWLPAHFHTEDTLRSVTNAD
jgi:hypothetical protein